MASTINADTSNGVVVTSDTTGEIELQSAGTTQAKITSSGLQNASGSAITSQAGRNLIINGNMAIDQRNAGASVTATSTTTVVDRFQIYAANITNAQTYQQVTDAPAGFNNSFKVTNSSTTQSGTNALYSPRQKIEGLNTAHLNWGTSDAQTVTLSFWVKASVTGTYPATLTNNNFSRSFVTSYTVSVANTWEYKTITIAGDTSGAWNVNNTTGINVMLSLDVEPAYQTSTVDAWQTANVRATSSDVHFLANASATWQITGLQLEAGTTATPFENLQYGQQLSLCQRYFEKSVAQEISITAVNKTSWIIPIYASTAVSGQNYGNRQFAVIKRAAPTISIYPYTTPTNLGRVSTDGGTDFGANSGIANTTQDSGFSVVNNSGGTLTTGAGQKMFIANWYATAEL